MFIQFLKENIFLYFFLVFYLLVGGIVLTQIDKGDMVIWLNQNHSSFQDFLFKNLTHIGEEWILLPVLGVFLLTNRYAAFLMFFSIILNGAIIQILKRFVFEDMLRPYLFFKDQGKIMEFYHFVEGVKIRKHHTFPSGHTNTGFAFLLIMAFLVKNQSLKIFFGVLAVMVGFSRIYLFQHFFIDTYVGGILAIIFSTVFYYYIDNKTNLKKHQYLNRR